MRLATASQLMAMVVTNGLLSATRATLRTTRLLVVIDADQRMRTGAVSIGCHSIEAILSSREIGAVQLFAKPIAVHDV